MANITDDGSVLPGIFSMGEYGEVQSSPTFSSSLLYLGEVKELIYPSDSRSLSKEFVEYSVLVNYKSDSSGGSTSTVFQNCLLVDLFGNSADTLSYTMRKPKQLFDLQNIFDTGSKVLILCAQGQSTLAYIIAGARFHTPKGLSNQEAGHNLFFEFNGLKCTINKDGELTTTFRGATDDQGVLLPSANKSAEGSSVSLEKDGSLNLYTAKKHQSIKINHTSKKINVDADQSFDVDSRGTMVFNALDDIGVTTGKAMNVLASDNVTILSSGVLVGAATDAWVKGTTYRAAEALKNQILSASLQVMQASLAAASASLTAAAQSMLIPIAGPIAASPAVSAASAAIAAAGVAATTMSAALQTFESGSSTYLSPKNLTD